MKFRRMRLIAKLDDVVPALAQYRRSLRKRLVAISKEYEDARKDVETKIEKYNNASVDMKNEAARAVKTSIMGLVNGNSSFPGLSELPEAEGYDNVFDTVVKEYRNLRVRKAPRSDDGSVDKNKLIEDVKKELVKFDGFQKKVTDEEKLKNSLDAYIEELGKRYGNKYANDWKPLSDAILHIQKYFAEYCTHLLNRVEAAKGNFDTLKNVAGDIGSTYLTALIKNTQDFNYYLRQFGSLYKAGKAPKGDEESKYTAVLTNMKNVFDAMQNADDALNDVSELLDKFIQAREGKDPDADAQGGETPPTGGVSGFGLDAFKDKP